MPVRINGKKLSKYRPTAANISNDQIVLIAPEIIARQRRGIIMPRELAASLNNDKVPHPCAGCLWSHTCIYLIMKRGEKLGLPFIRRDRGEASSRRHVVRRPKDVISAERSARFAAAEAILANTGITASGTSAASVLIVNAAEARAVAEQS